MSEDEKIWRRMKLIELANLVEDNASESEIKKIQKELGIIKDENTNNDVRLNLSQKYKDQLNRLKAYRSIDRMNNRRNRKMIIKTADSHIVELNSIKEFASFIGVSDSTVYKRLKYEVNQVLGGCRIIYIEGGKGNNG